MTVLVREFYPPATIAPSLEKELKDKIKALEQKVNSLQDSASISASASASASLTSIIELTEKIQELDMKVTEEIQELDMKVDHLQNQIKELEVDFQDSASSTMELNDKIKKMEEKLKALELSNQLELKVSTQDSASTTMELNDKIKKMEEKVKALCNIAAEEHQKKYKERNIPTNLELSNQIKELEVKLSKKLFPQ